jgi:hypothetical protein
MFSPEDIISIKTNCPDLAHLGLDIDRDEATGWPDDTLEAVSSIESLNSLTICLEIGADLHVDDDSIDIHGPDVDTGPHREPRISTEVAEAMFLHLRSKKQGTPLQRVDFVVADFEDPYYGGMLPNWEDGRAMAFVCEMSDFETGKSLCERHFDTEDIVPIVGERYMWVEPWNREEVRG